MMGTLTIVCNGILFLFTCFVVATDGAPTRPAYLAFAAALLVVPLLTIVALARTEAGSSRPQQGVLAGAQGGARRRAPLDRVAGACNLVLLAALCWALVDQHPHPDETGFVAFVAVTTVTPLLSALVLLGRGFVPGRGPAAASR